MTLEISEKFIEIIASSFIVWDSIKKSIERGNGLTQKQNKMIKLIETRIDRLFKEGLYSHDSKSDDFIAIAQAFIHMAYVRVHLVKVENLNIAKNYLEQCVDLIKEKELNPKVIVTAVKVFNNLANIYEKLKRSDKCIYFFEKSLRVLEIYTKGNGEKYPTPIDIVYCCGIIVKEEEEKLKEGRILERLYRFTLTSLINLTVKTNVASESWKSDNCKFILYKHKMLRQQSKKITSTKEKLDWVIETAQLSKYFLLHNRFTEARHHLAAASFVLKKFYEGEYVKMGKKEQTVAAAAAVADKSLSDQYYEMVANLAISWGLYGITLLHSSAERLLRNKGRGGEGEKRGEGERLKELKEVISRKLEEQTKGELLRFESMERDLKEFTICVTDKYVSDYSDAKLVFVNILKWLREARIYYTPEKSASVYVQIMRYISYAYRCLAFYELNKDEQLKLHKQRVNILEKVLETCDLNASNDVYRDIKLNIAVIYNTMLKIKTEEYELGDVTSQTELSNINYIKNETINNLQSCLNVN